MQKKYQKLVKKYIKKNTETIVQLPHETFMILLNCIQQHSNTFPNVIHTHSKTRPWALLSAKHHLLQKNCILVQDKSSDKYVLNFYKDGLMEHALNELENQQLSILQPPVFSIEEARMFFLQRYFRPDVAVFVSQQQHSPVSLSSEVSSMHLFYNKVMKCNGLPQEDSLFYGIQHYLNKKIPSVRASHLLCNDYFLWTDAQCEETDTITLFLNDKSTCVEMHLITLFFEKCADKFHWDVSSCMKAKSGSSVTYPRVFASCLRMITLLLSCAQIPFFYDHRKGKGIYTQPYVLFSSMMGQQQSSYLLQILVLMCLSFATRSYVFEEEKIWLLYSTKRQRTIALNNESEDGVYVFYKKSAYTSLKKYTMISCTEQELRDKLWFMFLNVKPLLQKMIQSLMKEWTETRRCNIESTVQWMVSTFFCITLFDVNKDVHSLEYNSIFVKPEIDYHLAYRLYRIILAHCPPSSVYYHLLLSCLDAILLKVVRSDYDPSYLSQIGYLTIPENGYITIALLFQFAYDVQKGVYPVSEEDMCYIRQIYCSGLRLNVKRRTRKNINKGDANAEFKTFFLENYNMDKNGDDDAMLFSIMMRLIECGTCDACCSGRLNCVHFSNPTLMQYYEQFMISPLIYMHSTPFFHSLFSGANDFSLRQYLLQQHPTLLCPELFTPHCF